MVAHVEHHIHGTRRSQTVAPPILDGASDAPIGVVLLPRRSAKGSHMEAEVSMRAKNCAGTVNPLQVP